MNVRILNIGIRLELYVYIALTPMLASYIAEKIYPCPGHTFKLLLAKYNCTSTGGGFAAPRIQNVEHGGLVAVSGRSPRLLLCIHHCVS
jgi:hypothetical protein